MKLVKENKYDIVKTLLEKSSVSFKTLEEKQKFSTQCVSSAINSQNEQMLAMLKFYGFTTDKKSEPNCDAWNNPQKFYSQSGNGGNTFFKDKISSKSVLSDIKSGITNIFESFGPGKK